MVNQESRAVNRPKTGLTRRSLLQASALAGFAPLLAASPAHSKASQGTLLLCDQRSQSVILVESQTLLSTRGRSLNLSKLWGWTPSSDRGLADLSPARSWVNVSDAKQAVTSRGAFLLASASGGMAVAIDRTRGSTYWAQALPRADNVHSLEMLPDGNIAVSASTAGYIRLYAASQGVRANRYVQHRLAGAHAVSWSESRSLLWALGASELHGLELTGTASRPALTLRYRYTLPATGGHDLAPVPGSPGDRWLSTSRNVYRFSSAAGTFVRATQPPGLDSSGVKSISQHPVTGQIITVRPDGQTSCEWCSSQVRFINPNRYDSLPSTSIYKARWWV
ncbi:DUF6528 family protein [Streptomyces sp. NBC_01264]|uniref:DUF6528 family protein n=1 Tax=Streptomyces sp. NBC_01264 TaxID=2903804 RepID=UPI002254193B|nr:DUF6528 family protein [Streptomyces sp. NBC_01264]MCX4783608.1 DUF6528 family protein [Streptomyces sp. NBC_01264]